MVHSQAVGGCDSGREVLPVPSARRCIRTVVMMGTIRRNSCAACPGEGALFLLWH